MRFWCTLLLLWLGVWAPAHAAAADAILAEVSTALAAGQYEDVMRVSGNGLAEPGIGDATRGRLLIVRGLARQALGNHSEALVDFTEALSVTALPAPERGRALFARGVSLDSLGRVEDAAGDYSAVLRLLPQATYALNNRANVRRRQGRIEDARRDYLASLRGNPNPQYPYFGLGQIAEAEGKSEEARSYYNNALSADPGFALALARLQAMGVPSETSAGLRADTGRIVLKPPSATKVPALPAPKPQRDHRKLAEERASAIVPLRPTIVESSAKGRGELAQLGAWHSEAEAQQGWMMARDIADGLLDRLQPLVVRVEIPGHGIFWRLRVRPDEPAAKFCARMSQKGVACFVTRG
jgi:tetratricopeptide (TPR) repeat protein